MKSNSLLYVLVITMVELLLINFDVTAEILIYEGGGGYNEPKRSFSPNELVKKNLLITEYGTTFHRFTQNTKFQFEELKVLQYTLPERNVIQFLSSNKNKVIEVKEVKAAVDEEMFNFQVKNKSGEVWMTINDNGIATVYPKNNELIEGLIEKDQAFSQSILQLQETISNLLNKLDNDEKVMNEMQIKLAYFSGGIYVIFVILGTGIIGILYNNFRKNTLSKKMRVKSR
jgi:hypothetical protein